MADMMSLGLWQTGDADFQPRATPTGGRKTLIAQPRSCQDPNNDRHGKVRRPKWGLVSLHN